MAGRQIVAGRLVVVSQLVVARRLVVTGRRKGAGWGSTTMVHVAPGLIGRRLVVAGKLILVIKVAVAGQ